MTLHLAPYSTYKSSGVLWVGEIPNHWHVTPVKRSYEIQLGKMLQTTAERPTDTRVPYLKAQHVQWLSVRTTDLPLMWASERDLETFAIQDGDLLACEGGEGGRCGLVYEAPTPCIIQNALHRVRSRSGDSTEYLQYVLLVASRRGWLTAINNKATIAHFTGEKFGSLLIPRPSSGEQQAIVAYLRFEDSRINRLIRNKRRLIALLTEQKQAIIQQAVTRGLDSDVPLKPSGVEWLGDTPAHWAVRSLANACNLIQTGPFGSQLHAHEYIQGGTPAINPSHMRGGRIVADPGVSVSDEKLLELSRHRLLEGDVVAARRGELGRSALVTKDEVGWLCGTGSILIRAKSQILAPSFLQAVFSSRGVSLALGLAAIGSTMSNLSAGKVGQLRIPVPDFEEQGRIVSFLEREDRLQHAAVARVQREIDLIREYRTRLIADVVTGQLDVRSLADTLSVPDCESLEEWSGDATWADGASDDVGAELLTEDVVEA